MTQQASDIVIIGGGVIGLSAAWRLAQRGARITVLDARHAGRASWAAAGMLAPLAETGAPGPLVDLGLESLRAYPGFLAALREETGNDVALVGPGMLRMAVTDEQEHALCRSLSWQKERNLPLEWLDGPAVRRLEPGVSPAVQAALLSPHEKHVNPRKLLEALVQACLRRRVSLLADTPATGVVSSDGRVTGVQTAAGTIPCGRLLMAGGAWSGQAAGVPNCKSLVTPVRGQMLSLDVSPSAPLRHTVYGHHWYLVPRAGNRVIVGATEERVGFDCGTTAAGVAALLAAAKELVPALADASLDSLWMGLRPVSADGLPLLGQMPGWQNVHVATGHGRNGILLTPITSGLMAEALLEDAPPPPAFDPARFVFTS